MCVHSRDIRCRFLFLEMKFTKIRCLGALCCSVEWEEFCTPKSLCRYKLAQMHGQPARQTENNILDEKWHESNPTLITNYCNNSLVLVRVVFCAHEEQERFALAVAGCHLRQWLLLFFFCIAFESFGYIFHSQNFILIKYECKRINDYDGARRQKKWTKIEGNTAIH